MIRSGLDSSYGWAQQKRSLAAWRVFSPFRRQVARPERTFYLGPGRKRKLADEIVTLDESKKGQG
jgi:hypothetical protein